jgi:hypothetical protein
MSKTSRHRRTAEQRCRWGATGTGVGIAVGGAMAAAFVSMGTASADDLLGSAGGDVTALAQAVDLNAVTAAADPAAAVPAQATFDAFEELVLTIDPNAFSSTTGDPTDFIGTLASEIDADVGSIDFGTDVEGTDVTLNTIAGQVSCLLDGSCTDVLSTVPTTGDDGFTVLEQFVADTYVPDVVPAVFVPSVDTDLATIAGDLDSYFANTVFGPDIFNVAEYVISALTPAAADAAAFVP